MRLWTRWYEYVRDNPLTAFKPRRLDDEDVVLDIYAIGHGDPEFGDVFIVDRWRVPHADVSTPVLQPGPYTMFVTLEAARASLPASAARLDDVALTEGYIEAWVC